MTPNEFWSKPIQFHEHHLDEEIVWYYPGCDFSPFYYRVNASELIEGRNS